MLDVDEKKDLRSGVEQATDFENSSCKECMNHDEQVRMPNAKGQEWRLKTGDHMETKSTESTAAGPTVGRNEPCPCGSGKKYKRCCGVDAAPKLSIPKVNLGGGAALGAPGMGGEIPPGAMPPGFDPSQMDPKMMQDLAQQFRKLPKSQMQRLQGLVQKAMAGKDVSEEAQALEGSLPVELQTMLQGFSGMAGAAGGAGGAPGLPQWLPEPEMTEDDARKLVAQAAAKGEISKEEADKLLGDVGAGVSAAEPAPSAAKKWWQLPGFKGKRS